MLYIVNEEPENYLWNISTAFEIYFRPEWLESPLAKQMVEGVDKSVVLSPYCIQSPVLGQIAPFYLSHGVQSLLLLLYLDDSFTLGTASFGNNCAKYILEIAKLKDITLYLNSDLYMPETPFEVTDAKTGQCVRDYESWLDYLLEHL